MTRAAAGGAASAHEEIEEGASLALDFSKLDAVRGVVPVAVQRADTREVVLLAYTNEAAMRESFRTRRLVLWSTSRGRLWEKGATSGCRFELVEARVNCEQNSLLYLVRPESDAPAAHRMLLQADRLPVAPFGKCRALTSDRAPDRSPCPARNRGA